MWNWGCIQAKMPRETLQHMEMDQKMVAPSPIQPGPGHFQGWGSHNSSGQSHHPHSQNFFLIPFPIQIKAIPPCKSARNPQKCPWTKRDSATIAEDALEKLLQGFSESSQFTLSCFSTNSQMLLRLHMELQLRTSKPGITQGSWRDVKAAALPLPQSQTGLCRDMEKDRRGKEQEMSPLRSSEPHPNLLILLCLLLAKHRVKEQFREPQSGLGWKAPER
ncbi:hypothetical protein WISP_55549 [Willisornis vidua]|uniref:Uncharacterized protein n=1 Tax=Willisornis vidua TaxID=1566151 RepID=A0ABQ9DI93_9PASS|nr:hypothetical protein WISP_55549 [Willisornis vidua]